MPYKDNEKKRENIIKNITPKTEKLSRRITDFVS
jgi:hypothetical protein